MWLIVRGLRNRVKECSAPNLKLAAGIFEFFLNKLQENEKVIDR